MSGPTPRIRAWRAAYRAAWVVRRGVRLLPWPHMNGAMAAVWCDGQVLLVQNSYNDFWSMPGGRLNAGEDYRQAAARELHEETGVIVDAGDLAFVHGEFLGHVLRRDRVEIFAVDVERRPKVTPEPVEIAATRWATPHEAMGLPLFGPTRRYLQSL
ncbi:MAG: NUDIX hydrolase [Minwuia sp.]|uniref:NUDIX hydrolase n=1 Tax=Minwuia sp. TaxID=2493630 RepID=UPI003A8B8AE7